MEYHVGPRTCLVPSARAHTQVRPYRRELPTLRADALHQNLPVACRGRPTCRPVSTTSRPPMEHHVGPWTCLVPSVRAHPCVRPYPCGFSLSAPFFIIRSDGAISNRNSRSLVGVDPRVDPSSPFRAILWNIMLVPGHAWCHLCGRTHGCAPTHADFPSPRHSSLFDPMVRSPMEIRHLAIPYENTSLYGSPGAYTGAPLPARIARPPRRRSPRESPGLILGNACGPIHGSARC